MEVAPSPCLEPRLREELIEAALKMAQHVKLVSLGTFEFLVDTTNDQSTFYFMETNPRLQVEHTVTEALSGVDLVQTQFKIAAGESLDSLVAILGGGKDASVPPPTGYAIQCRINMETLDENKG